MRHSLSSLRHGVIAIALVICGWLTFSPAPAFAADPCDTMTVDQTSSRVLGDQQRVAQAASQLSGYTVRVRAFDTAPNGSLDRYLNTMLSSCGSWQNAESSGTIVVIVFSLDRQSLVHLSNVSQSRTDAVRGAMTPYFRSSDFQGGVSAALAKTTSYMSGGNSNPDPAPAAPSKPINWAAVGVVFLWIGGAIVGVAVVIVLFFVVRRSIRRRRRTRDAKHQLDDQRVITNNALLPLDAFTDLDPQIQILKASVSDTVFSRLDGTLTSFIEARSSINETVDGLEARYANIGDNLEQIEVLTAGYRDAALMASSANDSLASLRAQTESTQLALESVSQTQSALSARLVALHARREDLQVEGFKTDTVDPLAEVADRLLSQADTQIKADHPGLVIDVLEQVETILDEADAKVEEGPRTRQRLAATHQELTRQVEDLLGRGETARSDHDLIGREFGRQGTNGLSPIKQLVSDINQARTKLDRAEKCLGIEQQDWSQADSLLVEAETLLSRASDGFVTITARREELEQLRTSLPEAIAELIEDARADRTRCENREGKQAKYVEQIDKLITSAQQLDVSSDLLSAQRAYDKLVIELAEIVSSSRKQHTRAGRARQQRRSSRSSSGYGYSQPDSGFGTGLAVGSAFGHSDPNPWPSSGSSSSSGGWSSDSGSSSSTSSGDWGGGGGSDSSTSSGGW